MRTFLFVAAVALLVIGCSSKSVDKGRRDRKEKQRLSKLAHAKQARQNSYGYDDSSYQDQYSSSGSWNYNYYVDEFVYETCQGPEGIITSPGYPDNMPYTNNYYCERFIEIPEGKVVVFTIENMDVELATQCMYDKVMISGSANSDDPTVLCGDADYCKSIVARGDKAEVSFYTDYSVTGQGFSITYTIEDDSQQESDCDLPEPTCAPSDYVCSNGRCIYWRWECDGYVDCNDGGDEADCPQGSYGYNSYAYNGPAYSAYETYGSY